METRETIRIALILALAFFYYCLALFVLFIPDIFSLNAAWNLLTTPIALIMCLSMFFVRAILERFFY
jgi:hypothetical protein